MPVIDLLTKSFSNNKPASSRPNRRKMQLVSALLRRARRGLVLGVVAMAATAAHAESPPSPPSQQTQGSVFSFIDSAIVVKPGETGGQGLLTIQLLNNVSKQVPKVVEFGPGSATVTAQVTGVIGDAAGGEWYVQIKAAGLDKNVTLTRHLRVDFNGASETRDYTITNAYSDKFSWNVVSLGGIMSWSDDRPIAAVVTVGPVPATNLVADAVLTDETTATAFAAGDLQICTNRTGNCNQTTTLGPNRTYRLFLRPPADVRPSPGKYTGSIELIASEAQSAAANVTIYVTDCLHRFFGIFALLVGVLLSGGVTVGIRNQLARLQLLAPAVALRTAFDALEKRAQPLKCLGRGAKTTVARIDDWQKRLSDSSLERNSFVPGWLSITAPTATASQPYQQMLDNAGAWTIALAQIIDKGLAPLSKLSTNGIDPAKLQAAQKAIADAWTAVDDLALPSDSLGDGPAPPAPATAALDDAIAVQLAKANAALVTAGIGAVALALSRPGATASEQLRFQIAVLGLASWIIAALLTGTVGSYILVFINLGFGTTNDLWACFLWGLGLPAVGGQLAQATPSSLASSLGVSLAKPGG
jgi:hypothetical protein